MTKDEARAALLELAARAGSPDASGLAAPLIDDAIDDAIDRWHEGDDPRPLHEALGMSLSLSEYAAWVGQRPAAELPP